MAYSIEAAIESGLFDEVMVSTDDSTIAETARQYGASVPFMRSAENSDDHSGTAEALLEVIGCYRAAGKMFEYGCCLYPTAPFMTAQKLKESYRFFAAQNADTLVPVVKFEFPVQRAFRVRSGRLFYAQPEYAKTRSQDLEPFYHDCGQFYWFKTDVFVHAKTLVTGNTTYYEIPGNEVRDIDTLDDWVIAEALYRCKK
jgi:pseudaminic acid cytidylyltransferase